MNKYPIKAEVVYTMRFQELKTFRKYELASGEILSVSQIRFSAYNAIPSYNSTNKLTAFEFGCQTVSISKLQQALDQLRSVAVERVVLEDKRTGHIINDVAIVDQSEKFYIDGKNKAWRKEDYVYHKKSTVLSVLKKSRGYYGSNWELNGYTVFAATDTSVEFGLAKIEFLIEVANTINKLNEGAMTLSQLCK